MPPSHTIETSNYEKFQTSNPFVRRLIDRFYVRLGRIVAELAPAPRSALDAGCGEGETLARLGGALPAHPVAIDLDPEAANFTAQRFPQAEVLSGSVYELPFADASFELVLCLEVLEHLQDPGAAVAELARVSSAAVVVSVPHEPWFRLGSLLRGKYVRGLGNHPEHVNHWDTKSLPDLLGSSPELEPVAITGSFPWLIAGCQGA